MRSAREIFRADAPAAVLFVRLAAGFTFLVAGTSKLRDLSGTTGFFTGLNFPAPEALATLVAVSETVAGVLVLLGLLTRLAVIPLMIIMIVAILATKVPTLVGGEFGPFPAPRGPNTGLMPFLSSVRLDFSMLMTTIFLLIVGSGPLSVDAKIVRSD
jgi:putative oxidoreductase